MDTEYDRKFEEMKKYIPFLESIIKRLESTSSAAANPRQAQLDKIKSLRDLLQDKKKRMKMENLLKCEQVLVNLCAKVEQRDFLPEKPATDTTYPHNSKQKEDKDLELVRNKLKSVSTNLVDYKDTLPEIARASRIEEICTPGSKEPALFQRRPNLKPSLSPESRSPQSPNQAQSSSKRSYTRVLVSPEPRSGRWESPDSNPDNLLFSRRSPKRVSPAYHKKERRKSKQGQSKKDKGLNITLNVPEDSLDSLSTKDILTRIMKCNDNDVDIETLREAKRQILSELNQTGANYDDISDLLLKSYESNKKAKRLNKKREEVEEGELSDSESEAIESIYGDVLLDSKSKQKSSSSTSKASDDKEQPRKIQICLVINSDKDGNPTEVPKPDEIPKTDESEFQMYEQKDIKIQELPDKKEDKVEESKPSNADEYKDTCVKPANFYKPIIEQEPSFNDKVCDKIPTLIEDLNKSSDALEDKAATIQKPESNISDNSLQINENTDIKKKEDTVEIPLLNEPTVASVDAAEKPKGNVVSEIDILQALKNEILGESLSVPGSDIVTPPLHQPKVTKVASAQEIAPKKRISFEKYKEKAAPPSKATTPLFIKDKPLPLKEDLSKKQSLKLTMKECERFNFPAKLALDDDDGSEDEETDQNISLDNIYDNIAPKSPDHNDSSVARNTPPVIIPVDSVKTAIVASKGDVDMRKMIPPPVFKNVGLNIPFSSPVPNKEPVPERIDPRKRRDAECPQFSQPGLDGPPFLSQPMKLDNTPFPPLINPDMPIGLPNFFPNMTPSRAPNMTPTLNPSMTPSRTPVMTPNARTYDMSSTQTEDDSSQKHVYAPMFMPFDKRDKESSIARETRPNYKPEMDDNRKMRWESNKDVNPTRKWDDRDSKSNSMQRDVPDYQKSRFNDSYSNYNKFQKNSRFSIDRRDSFNRSDGPQGNVSPFTRSDGPLTPTHHFGRHEAPMTPLPSFGRGDCPPTPSYQFGRSECPPTPIHSFGRSDAPSTPSHSFGRAECPSTPSHTFGRGDMPMTPSHQFGRSESTIRDPRLNRSNDGDNYQRNDRNQYYKDRNNKSYGGSDYNRSYREQSVGRNDRYNKYSSYDSETRHYNKDQQRPRREPSVGRAVSRDNEEKFHPRDRSYGQKGNDYRNENEHYRGNNDYGARKGFYRERSVGRTAPDDRHSSRAVSVGRNFEKRNEEKQLSVKPHVGRSFTIDTSVTSTFQDFLDSGRKMQVFDYTFDSRRKRASSVGRSLGRETSVGRSFGRESSVGRSLGRDSSVGRTFTQKPKQSTEVFENVKRRDFRRACSVGRDLASSTPEKSFRDIKAEFQLFKSRCDAEQAKRLERTSDAKKEDKKSDIPSNRQSRKDYYDNKSKKAPESSAKKPYSPRKNYRDPRLRKEYNDSRSKDTRFDDRNRRNSGIVYSNDNITKGTILGSGYGVKNYKIPKIKRPEPEPEVIIEKTETDKKADVDTAKKASDSKADLQKKDVQSKSETVTKGGKTEKLDNITDKKTQKKEKNPKGDISTQEKNKQISESKAKTQAAEASDKTKGTKSDSKKISESCDSDVEETIQRPVTRSSRKNALLQTPPNTRLRPKKAVIYDTDSDEEKSKEEEKPSKSQDLPTESKPAAENKNVNEKSDLPNVDDNSNTGDLESSFGIDDLEIFSDNINSDPVIDNINALIAGLDHDLEPSKMVTPTDFSSDLTLENMLDSITNQGKEDTKSLNEEESLNMISEVIKNDLNESSLNLANQNENNKTVSNIENTTTPINQSVNEVDAKSKDASETKSKMPDDLKNYQKPLPQDTSSLANNDEMVTTTDSNIQRSDKSDEKGEEQMDIDGSSTPDSTNNTIEPSESKPNNQESLPDSTNEVQNEPNSTVSSTHDNAEPSSSNKESTPAIDSIGNILSILKNKSKIKELLSMLGEQSADNDKIKKKLEKLSEIVSDEEDDSRDANNDNDETSKNDDIKKTTESVSVDQKDDDSSQEPNNDSKEKQNFNKLDEKQQSETKDDDLSAKEATQKDSTTDNKQNNEQEDIQKEHTDASDDLAYIESKDQKLSDSVEAVIAENNAFEDEMEKPVATAKKQPAKRGRRKNAKGKFTKNVVSKAKRVTRSSNTQPGPNRKKRSNELRKLQEDIKEMFMREDVLNATGIRMCRLAKLVDDKKEEAATIDPAPVVVVEKVKEIKAIEDALIEKPGKLKTKLKNKQKIEIPTDAEKKPNKLKSSKYKPGPKSKTKPKEDDDDDPYAFESDSVSDMMNDEPSTKSNDVKDDSSSDSEDESLASSRSVGSSEALSELKKKPKRKRSSWQSGIIKGRNRKKKTDAKTTDTSLSDDSLIPKKTVTIPDLNCFTDKSYCFRKDVSEYPCRLCEYTGSDIVHHYKENHPHSEIPLSRMNPETANEAIEQCEEINFQAVGKIPTDKYVCRFCFKEFAKKKSGILEAFFWHVVSMHTGEYKKLCSECINITRCPFNLDIPPPPKDVKGQLIGYICAKCNFTQISLENLKTHVIVRHNDEETDVYTINLAVMSKKTINTLLKRYNAAAPEPEPEKRVLRSRRSNQSFEASDDHSDVTDSDHTDEPIATRIKRKKKMPKETAAAAAPPKSSYYSKITFENDDNMSETMSNTGDSISTIKVEREEIEDDLLNTENPQHASEVTPETKATNAAPVAEETPQNTASDDIFAYPHFKISYTDAGLKEYVCCINGNENHYKTTLLISMKKHVQTKHSEMWDGYCFVCTVIVTPQGKHDFKECLQHYLDKHIDDFPVFEKPVKDEALAVPKTVAQSKPKINVRPLSDLVSTEDPEEAAEELPTLPKIESIVSLSAPLEVPIDEPSYERPPVMKTPPGPEVQVPFQYEKAQAKVMSMKQQVVLATMKSKSKLINVYKCAGRYCSFTTDFIEDALQHASMHQKIGGENAMICAYCNFDCLGNPIDLVMHVFKSHGMSPYSCGHCFYRAAASQLVAAHISTAHRGMETLILRSTATPPETKDSSMLTREDAVQYYTCSHGTCKFRTYTAKKFYEHLVQCHPNETWQTCYICAATPATPTELINHMKTHELNVYQCTWCVRGADNEAGLFAHTAYAHPDKQPQAYLRVITKKVGSDEYRVLPLASFSKTKVHVEIISSGNKENPLREAERSIELEKLIGHTNQMIESMATMTPIEPTTPKKTPVKETPVTHAVITKISSPKALESTPDKRPEKTSPTTLEEERSRMKTPILKKEPEETPTPTKRAPDDVIYCLDSDEDEPAPSVIDLSEEDAAVANMINPPPCVTPPKRPAAEAIESAQFRKVELQNLFKCPQCHLPFKNVQGFKRHTNICLQAATGPLACAHCGKRLSDRDALLAHYTIDHAAGSTASLSLCSVCGEKFVTIALTKKHMKLMHKVTNVMVSSKKTDEGTFVFTVAVIGPAPDPRAAPKRKLSGPSAEPPAKKRYGPRDIGELPINAILDELVHCSECVFSTKVRINMVRHLQLHALQQPVPQTAPVNPVPHLETNEMHFDRMVNLASSSVVTRAPEKPAQTTVTSQISAEEASRYPKFVAERQRYACGAKDCSYISLDEAMFNRHWNTLHSTLNQFHCVHCARNIFDSRPLTFERVMEHLRMHESTLYGCSSCLYCHYKKEPMESHLKTVHKAAKLVVVREEVEAVQTPAAAPGASRMDLKLWHCGLCPFKSCLRPAIVEHCGKLHQSKMQFKCGNCPFRASSAENVQKHVANSHPGSTEEIFYYFYEDGTLPDEPDGVPKWQKQRQKAGIADPLPEVKTEASEMSLAQLIASPQKGLPSSGTPLPPVDLNIVKQELTESFPDDDESLESLCQKYGQFCEPNGLCYKCPLCSVIEDTLELMQSHLFEELKYRRWECVMCSYRAYHGKGLAAHVASEHPGRRLPPRALPRDMTIEKWVAALLQHQTTAITANRENLAKQKILTERPPKPTKPEVAPASDEQKPKPTMTELQTAFGAFGQPANMMFCCPKCPYKIKDETLMRNHLENELNKIRWHCSECPVTYQTYHEAQFHCKSVHAPQSARPREAARDPALRAAWLAAALQVQKLSMKSLPVSQAPEPEAATEPAAESASDNSLLVVRYVEDAPAIEPPPRTPPVAANPPNPRKRPALSTDSDDDRLVIDEPAPAPAPPAAPAPAPAAAPSGVAKKKTGGGGPAGKCPYCDLQTKYKHVLRDHICNSHFGLKPYSCTLCDFHDFRNKVRDHVLATHPGHDHNSLIRPTPLPPNTTPAVELSANDMVCLTCQIVLPQGALDSHGRLNADHTFAAKGDVIVKCSICSELNVDVDAHRAHHSRAHADAKLNYSHLRILDDERNIRQSGYCNKRSMNAKEMSAHHCSAHPDLEPKFKVVPQLTFVSSNQEEIATKRKSDDETAGPVPKKVARKSTTKLPVQSVAKKSTTKLPFHAEETQLEYSYYGTEPEPLETYENVTTLMSFCNTMMPFTLKKLSEIIKISPRVLVEDIAKKPPPQ